MATSASHALEQARSINSKRLSVLMCLVGLLCVFRLVVYPIPEIAFLMLAFWMLAGLVYDLSMAKIARVIRAEVMQTVMFALDITLLAAVVAIA